MLNGWFTKRIREAPPAAPRHWYRFHTANFTYIVLSSSSFVDQLSSANAIDASVRRGDGEGGVRSENWARTTSYSSKFLCTAYQRSVVRGRSGATIATNTNTNQSTSTQRLSRTIISNTPASLTMTRQWRPPTTLRLKPKENG